MASSNRVSRVIPVTAALVVLLVVVAVILRLRGDEPATAPAPPQKSEAVYIEPTAEQIRKDEERLRQRWAARGEPDNPLPPNTNATSSAAEMANERFTGRVLEGTFTQPLSGATVTAYLIQGNDFQLSDGYPPVLDERRSATDGYFRFDPMEIAPSETLAWRVEYPGYASAVALYPAGRGLEDRLLASFILRQGGEISGVVVNTEGEPVANALVGDLVLEENFSAPRNGFYSSAFTRTGPDGAFTLKGLLLEREYRLPARADGHVEARSPGVKAGAKDVRIVLERRDASLRGVVTTHDGKPAPEAHVVIERHPHGTRTAARPGADGAFAFNSLASGSYVLRATLPDQPAFNPPTAEKTLLISPGEDAEAALAFPAPLGVTARFVEEASGDGVPAVKIYSDIPEAGERMRAFQVESDAEGVATFLGYPPGPELRMPVEFPAGWFPARSAQNRQGGGAYVWDGYLAVSKGDGSPRDVTIFLERGTTLAGQILEPDARTPAAEVSVMLAARNFHHVAVTDKEGRFGASVPRVAEVVLDTISEKGYANLKISTLQEVPEQRIVLEPFGTLRGLVKNEKGEGVRDLEVVVVRGEDPRALVRPEELDFTNHEGRFEIAQVAPGMLSLEVRFSASMPFTAPEPLELVLAPGEEKSDLLITLREGDYIEGYVKEKGTEKPVAEATIFTDIGRVAAQSDANGYFKLTGLPYDKPVNLITISKRGYVEAVRHNVSIYDGTLEVLLEPTGALSVRAVDPAGQPATNLTLRLLRAGSLELVEETTLTGREPVFTKDDLGGGAYRVDVVEMESARSRGLAGSAEFLFDPTKGAQEVVVPLRSGIALNGVVVDASSKAPVAGAEVVMLDSPRTGAMNGPPVDGGGERVLSDASGHFAFRDLPPGTYRLRATKDGMTSGVVEGEAGMDAAAVTIALSPAARIYGSIISADGKAAEGNEIFFTLGPRQPSTEPARATAGTYEKFLPQAGKWTVVATQPDAGEVLTREVTVQPGQALEVNFDFSSRIALSGSIRVNGAPAKAGETISLLGGDGAEVLLVPAGGGLYRAEVPAGIWRPVYLAGPAKVPVGEAFVLESGSGPQERNFDVQLGAINLVTLVPEGEAVEGQLVLEVEDRGAPAQVLNGWPVDRPSMRLFQIPQGRYRALLVKNGTPAGESAWTNVSVGGVTDMVIETR